MRGTRRAVVAGALTASVVAAVVVAALGAPWPWVVAVVAVVVVIAVVAGIVAGAGAAVVTAPDRDDDPAGTTDLPSEAPVAPVRDVDDLRAFFDRPPGSPPASGAPAPAALPGSAAGAAGPPDRGVPGGGSGAGGRSGAGGEEARRTRAVRPSAGTAAVVVLGGAVVLGGVVTAVVLGGSDDEPTAARPATSSGAAPATTGTSTASPTPTAAPLTAAAAGDLARTDLAPGDDGFVATLSFPGIVLEPRAVGITVAYPELRASSDGGRTVAHLEFPVWNCLSAAPPVDPPAAQCSRSLVEYADLGSPELDVERAGEEIELSGSFATYTRPNGSAPVYTGRSYAVVLRLTPADSSGTLELGGAQVGSVGPGSVGD